MKLIFGTDIRNDHINNEIRLLPQTLTFYQFKQIQALADTCKLFYNQLVFCDQLKVISSFTDKNRIITNVPNCIAGKKRSSFFTVSENFNSTELFFIVASLTGLFKHLILHLKQWRQV